MEELRKALDAAVPTVMQHAYEQLRMSDVIAVLGSLDFVVGEVDR